MIDRTPPSSIARHHHQRMLSGQERTLIGTIEPSWKIRLRLAGALVLAALGAPAQSPSVSNLSTRAQVGTGDGVLIPGFVVSPGSGTRRLLTRAAGPALGALGVVGALADPTMRVFDAGGAVVAANDNWGTPVGPRAFAAPALSTAFTQNGAFAFAPGSRDAVLIAEFAPGSYTIQVSGAGSTGGVALVEIYDLTPAAPTSTTVRVPQSTTGAGSSPSCRSRSRALAGPTSRAPAPPSTRSRVSRVAFSGRRSRPRNSPAPICST